MTTETMLESATITATFNRAKAFFAWAQGLRLVTVLSGLFAPMVFKNDAWVPLLPLATLIGAEILTYASDSVKSAAEKYHRAREFRDGLGWPVANTIRLEAAGIAGDRAIQRELRKLEARPHKFFDTTVESSPRRLLENLRQSAWYSERQHDAMSKWIAGAAAVIIIGAALYYVLAVNTLMQPGQQGDYATVVKTASGGIAAAVSLGLVRLAIAYRRASKAAKEAVKAADATLSKSTDPTETEAVLQLTTYQTSRSSAPSIPALSWTFQGEALNRLWDNYIQQK